MIRSLPVVDGDPVSAVQLVAELRRVHVESAAYWRGYATPEFFMPSAPGIWSAADQVRHLTKSIRPVTSALGLPRVVLRLLFGRARAPSRLYTALRADYHAALALGAHAGRFAPRPLVAIDGAVAESTRARIMDHHRSAVDALCRSAERWPEASLDAIRLPHPLLGRLTVREMLAFTLYHNLHHVQVAERRRLEKADRRIGG